MKGLCNLIFIMYMTKVFYVFAFILRVIWFILVISPLGIINAGF